MTESVYRTADDALTFCLDVLQATASALRNQATAGDHYDAGLREAAAYIEHRVIPSTRAAVRQASHSGASGAEVDSGS